MGTTGSYVNPMPRFPPPQVGHAMPPPPPSYPFAHNPSVPQGFSGPGQMHHQLQQHPSYFGPPFPGTRPTWTGYGFQRPPPSYGSQVTHPMVVPGPPTNSLPRTASPTQSSAGPPGTGFDHHSFTNSHAHNVSQVTRLGRNTILPPGTGSGQFRSFGGPQVSQDISGITSSDRSASERDTCAQTPLASAEETSVADSSEHSSVTEEGFVGSGSVHENNQLVNVVEKALGESEKEKVYDMKEVLSQLRSLLSQVEKAAKQVEALVNIDLGSDKGSTVACPFDPAHKIVAEGLFQHYLRCPSNPKPKFSASLTIESCGKRDISCGAVVNSRLLTSELTSGSTFSSGSEFDIFGGKFFYDGASAVVQASPSTVHPPLLGSPPAPDVKVTGRLSEELKTVDAVQRSSAGICRNTLLMLPSRYFYLSKEIEGWKNLPSRTSSLVIEAAVGLGKVGKREVVDWIILNSPAHGVVLDPILGCHMYTLARACFRDVQNKALTLIDQADYKRVAITSIDGEHVRTGGASDSDVTAPGDKNFPGGMEVEDNGSDRKDPDPARMDGLPSRLPVVCPKPPTPESLVVRSSHSSTQEMEAAICAVNERAILERYLRNPFPASCLPKFQLLQEYEAAVRLALEERPKRPNYRPILESDGLIWHRSQLEEKNKNKTREEILAEERDYKRRRMSYRGKKLKRTPTQVVRDIIEGHMEEIVAAGGIGSAVKQSLEASSTALHDSRGEMPVASNESTFTCGGQRRMPASNPSSVSRTDSHFKVNEKVRGWREHSHHSEPWKPNEGFRVRSKDMNMSRAENDVGEKPAGKQYQLNVEENISRHSKLRNRAGHSDPFDHGGGRSTSVRYRSSSEDQWENRSDSEDQNLRAHSHQQDGRYSTKRPNVSGMPEAHGHHDTRDDKSRRDYGYDSFKARRGQAKNSESYDRASRLTGPSGTRSVPEVTVQCPRWRWLFLFRILVCSGLRP
ncbi:hypothetical protein R1flu_021001 [Riccia fluitans]|uniref:CHHC U11-48K-type domain-containing protein n=1 Tax=Riccia fluitans TaxID=41844 RepID=A0ABD1ZN56_9MARC